MMRIQTLSREEAANFFNAYVEDNHLLETFYDSLTMDYIKLRNDLLKIEKESLCAESYKTDLSFGLKLYEYLNNCDWFNETLAGNYGFWRYVSLKVVPDIIERRCGFNAPYFYEKTTRMYIPKLWWYIYMSYQGSIEETEKVLSRLNTDYIMQLVERTGRSGFFLEISREIMRQFSILPSDVVNKRVNGSNLFRRVLIQNTAKMDNYNLVAEGDEKRYVNDLFLSCKVEVNKYEQN